MKLSELNKLIKGMTNTNPDIRIGVRNSNVDIEIVRLVSLSGGSEIILSPNESDRTYGKYKKTNDPS